MYEHDVRCTTGMTSPPHLSWAIWWYLNQRVFNLRIGYGGAQKWPPQSQDWKRVKIAVCGVT